MNLIMNPLSIRIPKNSFVLLCGVQNSGKTTFLKENFPSENILCNDDILSNIVKSNPEYDFYKATFAVQDYLTEKISSMGISGKNVVLDAIGFTNEERFGIILRFNEFFNKIIQIVVHPNLTTVLERPKKPILPYHKKLNMRNPTSNEIKSFWNIIQSNIKDGSIAVGTDVTYILSHTDNVSVSF